MILPLHLEDVSYGIDGRLLIDHFSLTLESGASTIVLGANGAGKSLLMRLMHGLIAPVSGTVMWRGRSAHPRRLHAMVFQRPVM
ncbi:MAG: ATP-binding cassette domain-containing protein, partial [Proteobacteria bacterium]|nr:ATP-binding cassette domain-containing protein [Pseudomonadota bacterium]